MNKTPLPVIVIGCIYIVTGVGGLILHLRDFKPQQPFDYDIVWISLVSLIALVSGVYMLRRGNWARWLALAWMAFHVVLSAFHSWSQVLVHGLLLAAFAYLLFRPAANEYFRGAGTQGA